MEGSITERDRCCTCVADDPFGSGSSAGSSLVTLEALRSCRHTDWKWALLFKPVKTLWIINLILNLSLSRVEAQWLLLCWVELHLSTLLTPSASWVRARSLILVHCRRKNEWCDGARIKVDSVCLCDRKFCPSLIRTGVKQEKHIWPSSEATAGLKHVNGRNRGRRWTSIDFEAETKRTRLPIGGRC